MAFHQERAVELVDSPSHRQALKREDNSCLLRAIKLESQLTDKEACGTMDPGR